MEGDPQNVKTITIRKSKKQAKSSAPKLQRTTFKTSREMDFFSEKELVTQTGHDIQEWPLVIVKELVDNALDACEEADTSPVIAVAAGAAGITIRDNGPGIPDETLRGAMDFTVRASNREAYVAPDRGAQGNALKTLLPMPRVLDPDNGQLVITTCGKRRVITCGADPISQRAVVRVEESAAAAAKSKKRRSAVHDKACLIAGTEIRLEWSKRSECGEVVWPFDDLGRWPMTGQSPSRIDFTSWSKALRFLIPTRRSRSTGSAPRPPGRRRTPPGKNGSRTNSRRRTGMKGRTWSG